MKYNDMVTKHMKHFGIDPNEYHQHIDDLEREWVRATKEERKDIELDIIDYLERL